MTVAAVARPLTLARATSRDLLRRPGPALVLVATATLTLLLPRLAQRALDAGPELAVELILSTIALHAGLFAALAGAAGATRGGALGPSTELFASPLRRTEYVLGRALGICAAAWTHGALLLATGALALTLHGGAAALGSLTVLAAALTVALQVLLLGAAGLASGAALGRQLGVVTVVLLFAATRVVFPALTASGDPSSFWLPDIARLDIAREAGFSRPLGAGALATAAGGAIIQALGLLALARCALRHGDRGRP